MKKDFPSSSEELEFSKSEEVHKLKLVRSRTEFRMPFVPPELPSRKVLSSVVDVPCCTLHEL